MQRKSAARKSKSAIPLLLVGVPCPQLDRKVALLESNGFLVTCAYNICYAELYAAQQYFDIAVYDDSISAQEQISLARIMRVRWPWMRILTMSTLPSYAAPDLFDSWSLSEADLPAALNRILMS